MEVKLFFSVVKGQHNSTIVGVQGCLVLGGVMSIGS